MIDWIVSATYNSYFLGASITASGLPAAILQVGSLLTSDVIAMYDLCSDEQ